MGERTRKVMERVQARGFDPRLSGVRASYRFDIEEGGSYHVEVDDGMVVVKESAEPASCVITSTEDDFVAIMSGQRNLVTAFLQGRLKIDGDLGLARLLHGVLPSSERGSGTRSEGG